MAGEPVQPNDPNRDDNGFSKWPRWMDTKEVDERETKRTTIAGRPPVTKYVKMLVKDEEEANQLISDGVLRNPDEGKQNPDEVKQANSDQKKVSW